eukprot:gene17036-20256_t
MDAPEISSIVLRTDVRLTSELPVASRSLSISGECAEALCIVDGGGAFQPFYVQLYWNIDEFIIDRISITNGYAVQGGGIYVDWGNVIITNSQIINCTARKSGGAVYAGNGRFTVDACDMSSNFANDWGGAVNFANGTLSISGCIFTGNIAKLGGAIQLNRYEEGGALVDTLNVVIVDTIFRDNVAEADGGGLSVVEYPDDHLSLSIIDTNLQYWNGGGGARITYRMARIASMWNLHRTERRRLRLMHTSSIAWVDEYEWVALCTVQYGGGLYVTMGDVYINNTAIVSNFALYDGGALYLETGYTELRDTIFSSNAAK